MKPTVTLSVHFDELVCACRGDFDLATRGLLRAMDGQVMSDTHTGLVLDLTEVRFLDCGSVRVLGEMLRSWVNADRSAVVVCPAGFLHQLLGLTGFASEFRVVPAVLPLASANRGSDIRVVVDPAAHPDEPVA
jgi:anti-anti-sigma factor